MRTILALRSIFSLLVLTLSSTVVPTYATEDDRGEARKRIEPQGFVYGFGLGVSQEIYKGFERRVIPIPFIGYRSNKWRIFGPFISYDLAELGDLDISLKASPRFQGFEESDSTAFVGMEKRKTSLDGGIGLRYEKKDWNANLSLLRDLLSNSNGLETKASLGRVFRFGPIFVEPSIAVSHLDEPHVDYYYGVRQAEATAERPFYRGKTASNTSAGISVATPILFGGFTRLALSQTWFDDAITDSPLVEDDASLGMMLLFSKYF